MAFNHEYPYVDAQIFNDDWLLAQMKKLMSEFNNFINLNKIKYANPILWDITSQYEINTIVIDPQTGDAYISVAAVPYGVSLSNTEYWTKIFNYSKSINTLQEQIAAANEELSTTATAPRTIGDLVWLNGLLYRITANMIAGDSYVVNSNCVKTTIEEEIARVVEVLQPTINDIIEAVGNLNSLNTEDKTNLVAAINEVLNDLEVTAGSLSDLVTTDKSSLVNAINETFVSLTSLASYINVSRTKSYLTVAAMIADDALTDGESVSTLGYSVVGIGGAVYNISDTAGTAAIALHNGLYANIVVNDDIHLSQLGAVADSDISNLLVTAVTLINRNGTIHFDANYKISSAVSIALSTRDNLTINGHEHNVTFDEDTSQIAFGVTGTFDRNINIINCDFYGNGKNNCLLFTGFMSAVNRHEIKNCQFWGFKHAIYISNSRMILIDNIAIWDIPDNGEGISLVASSNGFVGDIEIRNSQFAAENGNTGNSNEIILNVASGSTAAGIIIDGVDFYGCTNCFKNVGTGTCNDIWIINSQFDGSSSHSIYLTGSGALNDLHIKNNYDTAPLDFVTIYKPSGTAKAIFIEGNYINGYIAATPAININCDNKSSINISENIFINCRNTAGALIAVYNVRAAKVTNNICDMDSGAYLANVVELNNCVNAICTNNIANNVASTAYLDTGNTNKVFDNNIP